MFTCVVYLPNSFEHEWSHENLRVKVSPWKYSLSTILTIYSYRLECYNTSEMGHTKMDGTSRPYGNRKYVLISINHQCNLHKPYATSSFLYKHKQPAVAFDQPTCNTNVYNRSLWCEHKLTHHGHTVAFFETLKQFLAQATAGSTGLVPFLIVHPRASTWHA